MVPLDDGQTQKDRPGVGEAAGTYAAPVIYLTPLYFGEKGVAERTCRPWHAPGAAALNRVLIHAEALSDEQHAAIDMALTHPVSILTGGPGTGKTTCLKALIAALEDAGT